MESAFQGSNPSATAQELHPGILGVNRVALLAEACSDENGPSKHRPDAGHY